MSLYLRRFLTDPGNEVLTEIESVNVLDLDPPASITGVGTGTVMLVGEYEDGPFNEVVEVTGTTDLVNTRGELGFSYAGVKGNNPSARGRKADGALAFERWNGNAFVQLSGKRFRRLVTLRPDTSVGSVEFRRQASVTGASGFSYNVEPGQILALDIGAGPVSATFTATAATVTSGAGTYPTTFVGGETLTLGYDGATNVVVTFLAADQTKAQVIARINQYAGFTMATDGGTTLIILTGIQRGSGGQVRVVSSSPGSVLTALGLVAATTLGTGNVGNVDAVTFAEIRTVVQTAVAGTTVEQDSQGRLRISKTYAADADYIQVGTATTATALGLVVDQHGSADGAANYRSTAQTFPTVTAGTLTLGVDDEPNFAVTIAGGQSQATVITNINAAAGFAMASSVSATIMLLRGRKNGGQVRVVGASAALVLTELGFISKTITAPAIVTGKLPAGTQVSNTAGTRVFVTMQTIQVDAPSGGGPSGAAYAGNVGPHAVKIRHALDDGTGLSASAGTLTVITAPDLGSFSVTNAQAATAALSEAAIDAAYVTAIDASLDLNTVARDVNVVYSARQSNTIRRKLRENAVTASANGCMGRIAITRTPLGTTKTAALSRLAEPGVGAYRDQRNVFCWPQANTFIPLIARRGLAGGDGFTADGNVDVGADGFMASILSQLPPEENPGQLTPFANGVNSLETSLNAAGLTMVDYTLFRANGIAALRVDDGVAVFQSGVTSVDPSTFPQLRNIARRRMADFIQDTLARRLKGFGKKLNTRARRAAISGEIRAFMATLLSSNNPTSQRIDGFSLDEISGNTPTTLAAGIFRVILKVRTLSSLDAITVEATVGEAVTIDEKVSQAA